MVRQYERRSMVAEGAVVECEGKQVPRLLGMSKVETEMQDLARMDTWPSECNGGHVVQRYNPEVA